MHAQPQQKYAAATPVALPDRTWPNQTLKHPPVWMSTDLRDGNQALFEPMNGETKLRLFQTLVAIGWIKAQAAAQPGTEWVFQFSPETFSATEPDFALSVCNAVIAAWQPTEAQPMVINLPATVECSTPNVYADQIEWMHRHLAQREAVVLSVPHNDRGTAVAATELALMAGAQRVEGCARQVAQATGLPVHPRHPYAGDLVFTAFSGSHQDAIRKGLAVQQPDQPWRVPYLPIDPRDVGASYEAVIRVNSQSGKGGISYLLESAYGLVMPRRAQIEFSRVVQDVSDDTGRELSASTLWTLFKDTYMAVQTPWHLRHAEVMASEDTGDEDGRARRTRVSLRMQTPDGERTLHGTGQGPLHAAWQALQGLPLPAGAQWHGFEEHAMGQGADAQALAWVELGAPGMGASVYGAGRDGHIVQASLQAMVQAANRLHAVAQGMLAIGEQAKVASSKGVSLHHEEGSA
jgi:2-isopropylmalate synthase